MDMDIKQAVIGRFKARFPIQKFCLERMPDLVAAEKMDDDGQVGHANQPVGLEETKACQQIAWNVIIPNLHPASISDSVSVNQPVLKAKLGYPTVYTLWLSASKGRHIQQQ